MERLTPKMACRQFCIQCLGLKQFNTKAIEGCQGDKAACGPCPLYHYRMGKRISVKIFRLHCLYCMGNQRTLVEDCETLDCELWPYRMGKSPSRAGTFRGSKEARQKGFFKQGSTKTKKA